MLIESYSKEEPIQLDIILCKPDYKRTQIAHLSSAYDKTYTGKFAAMDEINFKIPHKLEDEIANEDYEYTKGDFVLHIEFNGNVKYFIIKECTEEIKGKQVYKQIKGYSYEYVLTHKNIRKFEDTLTLQEAFDMILSRYPSWTIGKRDEQLLAKTRTLNISEKNILDVLNDLQKTYHCVFQYDTVNRQINIHSIEDVGVHKGLLLSQKNYVKSASIKPDFSQVITRLRCFGNDDLSITTQNATGANYVETFEYYMKPFKREKATNGSWIVTKHSDYMSDHLCMSILNYQILLKENEGKFREYLDKKIGLEKELFQLKYNKDQGLSKLKNELDIIEDKIDAKIRLGDSDLSGLKKEKKDKEAEIVEKEAVIHSKNGQIVSLDQEIMELKQLLSMENNYTHDELKELDMFVKERSWHDQNYIEEKDLYEEGKKILSRGAQPNITFAINAINFLQAVEASPDWEAITHSVGDLISIEIEKLDEYFEVRLISFTYSEGSNSLNLKYSNKNSIDDPILFLKDILKESISTSTTLNMKDHIYGRYAKDQSKVLNFIDNELDLAKQKAFAGKDQEVIIDKSGVSLINKDDPDSQIKMIGGLVAFTNNGWNTAGTAISSQGVVAESVYGKIIAGENLTIENSGGSFKVDRDGVTIKGADLTITNGLPESQINAATVNKWNSAEQNAKIYVDREMNEVNTAITNLEDSVSSMFTDGEITLVEANGLELSFSIVQSESADLISGASSLGITTERTNYLNALAALQASLDKFIKKSEDSYPIKISLSERSNIDSRFKTVQKKKSILINKVVEMRETNANKYTDNNAVSVKKTYNGVKINSRDGVTVRTKERDSKGAIKTSLNASEGIKIQYHDGNEWKNRFSIDSDNGNISANNLQLEGGKINNNSGKTIIDVSQGQLNLSNVNVIGKLSADNIDVDNIQINSANILGSISYSLISGAPSMPNYIKSTKITSTNIESPIVQGGLLVGSTIKTANAGKRITLNERNGNDIKIYSENNVVAGIIDYDEGGGEGYDSPNRIFFRTQGSYALKLKSDVDMSLEADTIYAVGALHQSGGEIDFYGDVSFHGNVRGITAVFG